MKLIDKFAGSPVISPDGGLIAFYYFDEQTSSPKIGVIPFEGGQLVKVFDLAPTAVPTSGYTPIRWARDGRALMYIDTRKGVSNIWSQPTGGGKPVQLTDFKSDQIFWFDWSRDGKQLALARGNQTSDVVLISNFR